jgi:hypothetical protein
MRQFITSLLAGVGVAALVGGICAMVYGAWHPGTTMVTGLSPLNGPWPAENYWFLGGVLAGVGSGFATFGLCMRRTQ